MKWLLLLGGGAILLIVVILVIGALLPKNHVASREVVLPQSPSEIYAVIRDFAAASKWRPDVARVEMLDPIAGHVRFREDSNHGRITYEVTEERAPEKLVTRIVDQDLGYSGRWTYELFPARPGTKIRITENGEVSNVLFRFLSRFVFGHTATIDAYLRALGQKFGENVIPKSR